MCEKKKIQFTCPCCGGHSLIAQTVRTEHKKIQFFSDETSEYTETIYHDLEVSYFCEDCEEAYDYFEFVG